jgi:UDP-N-acetylglucosamine acyltransferase
VSTVVHPSAIVDASAELGFGVRIGPYCVIGPRVAIGDGCILESHVIVQGPSRIGDRNHFHPFCAIGTDAQQRATPSPEAVLVIGADNVFREHVTVHRGTQEGTTVIGNRNLFMVGVHIAHDVVVGSNVTVANGVQIAGHAVIDDFANFGGLAAVAQFVHVGESAFVAGGAMCERSVPPFVIVQGDRARVRALNRVGLERRGFTREQVRTLKRAFRGVYTQNEASIFVAARALDVDHPLVRKFVEGVLSLEPKAPPPEDDEPHEYYLDA